MDIVKFETEQIEKKNNEAKRTAVTEEQKQKVEKVLFLSEEVMRSLKSFQDLNNMLYERTARFMYENSIMYYINYFKQPVLDFKKFHNIDDSVVLTN
jgi:hypothetical protein